MSYFFSPSFDIGSRLAQGSGDQPFDLSVLTNLRTLTVSVSDTRNVMNNGGAMYNLASVLTPKNSSSLLTFVLRLENPVPSRSIPLSAPPRGWGELDRLATSGRFPLLQQFVVQFALSGRQKDSVEGRIFLKEGIEWLLPLTATSSLFDFVVCFPLA